MSGEGFGEVLEGAEVVVVALAALVDVEEGEEGVVEVVAPLGVHAVAAGFAGADDAGIVEVALGDEDETAAEGGSEGFDLGGELLEEVDGGAVDELVDGVEAEAVDVVVAHPHEGVVDRRSGGLRRCLRPRS